MFDFFRSLFRPAPPSGETAKERLRLVLLSDHLSLAPDVVDSLKRDLIEVISRYVEIDIDHADVTFEHREREIAMLASIPITAVRDRKAPEAPPSVPDAVSSAPPAEVVEPFFTDEPVEVEVEVEAHAPAPVEPEPLHVAEAQPELELEPAPEPALATAKPKAKQPVRASNGAAPRRRRRKKHANGAVASPTRSGSQLASQQAKASP